MSTKDTGNLVDAQYILYKGQHNHLTAVLNVEIHIIHSQIYIIPINKSLDNEVKISLTTSLNLSLALCTILYLN
jgi:hypothetical protein